MQRFADDRLQCERLGEEAVRVRQRVLVAVAELVPLAQGDDGFADGLAVVRLWTIGVVPIGVTASQ
ncbi:hypothetical protein ACFY2Y_05165 [Janibacter hoylei]|uniref:hypothetical protein n=1 Tax=Janibacter TaxID=53457 RepID=UPI00248F9090|nr:hypothetical protein [Janibacter hoylei]